METIEVMYKPVKGFPGRLHKFIVYTDRSGKKRAARGGPGGFNFGSPAFQDVVTEYGFYEKEFPDWAPAGAYESEVIASREDLSREWSLIRSSMDDIESKEYPYSLLQNSNTVVDKALRDAGLSAPSMYKGGPRDPAPGSGQEFFSWTESRDDHRPRASDFPASRKEDRLPMRRPADPSRTLMGGFTTPSDLTGPYPDRDTTFSPSIGPATRFDKPVVPIPRPRPERSGALRYGPTREEMRKHATIVEEIEEIERLLKRDRRAYFRDEEKQARYRELLMLREKNRAWA